MRGCVHIAADEIPYGTVISVPTRYNANTNMAFDKCSCFINIPIKKQIVGHELESGLVQFHFSECGRSPSVCHNLGPMHKSNELWVNLSMYTIRYHFFFFFFVQHAKGHQDRKGGREIMCSLIPRKTMHINLDLMMLKLFRIIGIYTEKGATL